ncbi:unnamed protein product, partial [Coregonus sp. 'balchen']
VKQIGLGVEAFDWFQNYLSDRTQCVAKEGMKSEYRQLTKGVPQGKDLVQGIKQKKSVLEYGDIVYMQDSASTLKILDTVYHGALRFLTNARPLTQHCDL